MNVCVTCVDGQAGFGLGRGIREFYGAASVYLHTVDLATRQRVSPALITGEDVFE